MRGQPSAQEPLPSRYYSAKERNRRRSDSRFTPIHFATKSVSLVQEEGHQARRGLLSINTSNNDIVNISLATFDTEKPLVGEQLEGAWQLLRAERAPVRQPKACSTTMRVAECR